ncbi:AAA family ATPase [Bosea sp. ANAM02]|uniref:AAA family ATPase n=1 Tax=Bosea sp. ANAM02 TaxID=2020412 RepID=UPI00140F1331|nr:AAA family ATPase [Bosea sp. ANAM02]BCB17118.1 hypothetical protein OCUBac02_00120 [Bosea sp. ANAM02]
MSAYTPHESDSLARAYLNILIEKEKDRQELHSRFVINDDEDVPQRGSLSHLVRPDLAAIAILAARAIEAEPGLSKRLRRGSPIITIATNSPPLVETVKEIFSLCVFPYGSKLIEIEGDDLFVRKSDAAVVIARDGARKDHRPDKGNRAISIALQNRLPIVGIAPDPDLYLPSALLRTAEHRLRLPVLDTSALALLIEFLTGEAPTTPLDEETFRQVGIEDLPLMLRGRMTADDCIASLQHVVRSKAQDPVSGPRLEDLAGYGEAKIWGLELAADLAELKSGRLSWAEIDHKGLLLTGAPGTGKTQFGKALAKSAGVPLIATSVAQWNAASHLSGTLQAIREVFQRARQQAPCILLIDEIDGISDRAMLRGEYVEYWSQIVNLLLEQLAGIDQRPGVVVIAATNFPDRVDAAVKRSGRLDRVIEISKPSADDLAQIFRFHLGPETLADADLMQLALPAKGATGADVEAIVQRAKGTARRAKRELSVDCLLAEIASRHPPLSAQDRNLIAVHEAGHALVGLVLGVGTVVGASVHAAGGGIDIRTDMTGSLTLDYLQNHIAMLLAGRAAERVALGQMSIGAGMSASSDLAKATRLAVLVETQSGLGQMGPVYVDDREAAAISPALFLAVKQHLLEGDERATAVLVAQKRALMTLANALNSRGYLSGADIRAIVGTIRDEPPNHAVTVEDPAPEAA